MRTILGLFLVVMLGADTAAAFLVGADGWTILEPGTDSRAIYVSSSTGNDGNDGLSPERPVASITEGKSRLRSGYPDHLLLKRGDVWNHGFGYWSHSGRSLNEPAVVSSYGDSEVRPRVVATNEPGIRTQDRVDYVAFAGLHLQVAGRSASSGPAGVYWLSPSRGILFEDCRIEGFSRNLVVQGYFGLIEDFRMRRCVVIDCYDTVTLSEGLYAENVDGMWLEGNLFDYNGWHAGIYPQSTLNHNVYIHAECKNFVAVGNIISRASSHGLQARPGGLVEGNLFVQCPIALSFGYVLGNSPPTAGGIGGAVRGNAFLEGNDIGSLPRGVGVQVANISPSLGAEISGNYFVRNASSMPYGAAIELQAGNGLGVNNTVVSGNVCYGYNAGITSEGIETKYRNLEIRDNYFVPIDTYSFVAHHRYAFVPSQMRYSGNVYSSPKNQATWFRANGVLYNLAGWKTLTGDSLATAMNGAFPDASRTMATYAGHVGLTGMTTAFLDEARKQTRFNWRDELTAARAIDYLAVGFGGIDPYQPCAFDVIVDHVEQSPIQLEQNGATGSAGAVTADGCAIALDPPGGLYEFGQTVTCTAIPQPGHRFLYWEGELLGATSNPAQVVANGDMTVKAAFADQHTPLYTLDLAIEGDGHVTVLPPGNHYPIGTTVTLVAEPSHAPIAGSFLGYEGDVSSPDPQVAITINGDTYVTASFSTEPALDATSAVALATAVLFTALISVPRLRACRRGYTRM